AKCEQHHDYKTPKLVGSHHPSARNHRPSEKNKDEAHFCAYQEQRILLWISFIADRSPGRPWTATRNNDLWLGGECKGFYTKCLTCQWVTNTMATDQKSIVRKIGRGERI